MNYQGKGIFGGADMALRDNTDRNRTVFTTTINKYSFDAWFFSSISL